MKECGWTWRKFCLIEKIRYSEVSRFTGGFGLVHTIGKMLGGAKTCLQRRPAPGRGFENYLLCTFYDTQCFSRHCERTKRPLKFSQHLSKYNGTTPHKHQQNTLKRRFVTISAFRLNSCGPPPRRLSGHLRSSLQQNPDNASRFMRWHARGITGALIRAMRCTGDGTGGNYVTHEQ